MTDFKDFNLPESLIRNLSDKSYDKRKIGAHELEQFIKTTSPDSNLVKHIISILLKDFLSNSLSNKRKGGLIGLAGLVIAIGNNDYYSPISEYLQIFMPSIIKLLSDTDPKVRYYCAESLYNILKVVRSKSLLYFYTIFEYLINNVCDTDTDVRNSVLLLDKLMKEIAITAEVTEFDLDKFIILLYNNLLLPDSLVRQFLQSWLLALYNAPRFNIIVYLPKFLTGLFEMLGDSSKDLRQQTEYILAEFLKELKVKKILLQLDLAKMISILIDQLTGKLERPPNNRLIALDWLIEFINIAHFNIVPYSADIINAILHTTADHDETIRKKAKTANEQLLTVLQQLQAPTKEKFSFESFISTLESYLQHNYEPTKINTLKVFTGLLSTQPYIVSTLAEKCLGSLLKTLEDPSDEVISLVIEALSRLSAEQRRFEMILKYIISMFRNNRALLDKKCPLIIRKMGQFLDNELLYRTLSTILLNESDLEFACLIIQTLNFILMTSQELYSLRSIIKNNCVREHSELFTVLYKTWSHNCVATLSLCLFCSAYELASALVYKFAEINITVDIMTQIDKFIQLLESPVFLHVRMHLLEPNKNPFLIKCLYEILMLLPQTSSFHLLRKRLKAITALSSISIPESKISVPLYSGTKSNINNQALLGHFQQIQQQHSLSFKKSQQKQFNRTGTK